MRKNIGASCVTLGEGFLLSGPHVLIGTGVSTVTCLAGLGLNQGKVRPHETPEPAASHRCLVFRVHRVTPGQGEGRGTPACRPRQPRGIQVWLRPQGHAVRQMPHLWN